MPPAARGALAIGPGSDGIFRLPILVVQPVNRPVSERFLAVFSWFSGWVSM